MWNFIFNLETERNNSKIYSIKLSIKFLRNIFINLSEKVIQNRFEDQYIAYRKTT